MTVLVADVGGTNSRVALIGPDGAACDIVRYENDRYSGFQDILAEYLAQHDLRSVNGCCVAIAGPVTSDRASLTNRDWVFSASAIAELIPDVRASSVRLVNDLVALGHALPALSGAQLTEIRPSQSRTMLNDQALVAGLGTGFNVCLVKGGQMSPVVIEAELGHASLPSSVATALRNVIGAASDEFVTVETLFSGRGLSRLYCILSDGEHRQGQDILTSYVRDLDGPVTQSVDLSARLLGIFARELVFQYLPFSGIYFAGGAARGVLGSDARREFLGAFELPGRFADHVGRVPVHVITDDAAALTGAARIFQSTVCRNTGQVFG